MNSSILLTHIRFRRAALQMQEICNSTENYNIINEEQINHFLEQLPRELDPFYDRIVANIPLSLRRYLEVALQWITFACRPPFVEEIIAACTIERNKYGCPSSIGKQILSVSNVEESLRGMVEIQPLPAPGDVFSTLSPRHFTFQLVHQTVGEYLFPMPDFDRPAGRLRFEAIVAHTYLAQCCLVYLSYCARQRDGRSSVYPLRSYAWHSWPMHFTSSADPDAAKARPTLESLRLHNSIIYPALYHGNGDFAQNTSKMAAKLQEFLGFLEPAAQVLLKGAIQDASFPSSIPEEDWTWRTYWSTARDYAGSLRLIIPHPSEKFESKIECNLLEKSL